MRQPTLFDAPLARHTDPETSHEAAKRMARSGRAKAHAAVALAIVHRAPGRTYQELWAEATDAERETLGDAVELMRRLGDLRRAGTVSNGVARVCRVKGNRMMTWEAV